MIKKIEIKNATIAKKEIVILEKVSVTFLAGEISLILGENGTGKSSFLKGIFDYDDYTITDGSFFCDEVDFTKKKLEEKAVSGLFFSPQHTPSLDGISFISLLYLSYKKINESYTKNIIAFRSEVQEKIKIFDLDESLLERKFGKDFSGGEKKQTELIQALILNKNFLFLDEIDSGASIKLTENIIKIINILKEKGLGIVLITHNKEMMKNLNIDKVFSLEKGVFTEIKKEHLKL